MSSNYLLISIISLFLFIQCSSDKEQSIERKIENEQIESTSDTIVNETVNPKLSWEDSIIGVLENFKISLKYTEEEQQDEIYINDVELKSPFELWSVRPNRELKPAYRDDMEYRAMLYELDRVNQFALGLLKKEAITNHFNGNVTEQIYKEFNVLNYGLMGKNAKYFGHIYLNQIHTSDKTTIIENTIIYEDTTWFSKFEILEKADFDGDGIMDLLVKHSEHAKGVGSHRASKSIILSKLSTDADIIYVPIEDVNFHNPFEGFMNKEVKGIIGNDNIVLDLESTNNVRVEGKITFVDDGFTYDVYGFLIGNGFCHLSIGGTGNSNYLMKHLMYLTGKIENNKFIGYAERWDDENQKRLDVKIACITVIGDANIWRSNYDSINNKWSNVKISGISGFKKRVDIGDLVQVIPLRKELTSLLLPITQVTYRDDAYKWYEIELEQVENDVYATISSLPERSDEYPGEVLIVCPPVNDCKLMDTQKLNLEDLPKNVTLEIIKGALDFNNDNKPDALVLEFCCKNRKKMNNTTCDYTCGETYYKLNGKWIMIDSSQPM